jgi:hypothetical protein
MWAHSMRRVPHDDQSGTQAEEGYHSALKGRFIKPEKQVSGRRVDWLLYLLLETVEPEYQRQAAAQQHGFVRNSHVEKEMAVAAAGAALIPDTCVTVQSSTVIGVSSRSRTAHLHLVQHPNTERSTCTCEQGFVGRVCAHQIKAAGAVSGKSISQVQHDVRLGLHTRKPGLALMQQQQPIVPALDAAQLRLRLDGMWQDALAPAAAGCASSSSAQQQPAGRAAAAPPPAPRANGGSGSALEQPAGFLGAGPPQDKRRKSCLEAATHTSRSARRTRGGGAGFAKVGKKRGRPRATTYAERLSSGRQPAAARGQQAAARGQQAAAGGPALAASPLQQVLVQHYLLLHQQQHGV